MDAELEVVVFNENPVDREEELERGEAKPEEENKLEAEGVLVVVLAAPVEDPNNDEDNDDVVAGADVAGENAPNWDVEEAAELEAEEEPKILGAVNPDEVPEAAVEAGVVVAAAELKENENGAAEEEDAPKVDAVGAGDCEAAPKAEEIGVEDDEAAPKPKEGVEAPEDAPKPNEGAEEAEEGAPNPNEGAGEEAPTPKEGVDAPTPKEGVEEEEEERENEKGEAD